MSHSPQVPDKRWYWLKSCALATVGNWDALEKFSKEKRPPGGGQSPDLVIYNLTDLIYNLTFTFFHTRSATGSNNPFALQIEHPLVVHEDIATYEVSLKTMQYTKEKANYHEEVYTK
uniref:Vps16 C-terminal domain-containing protein n=1 Tax=Oryza brachyantha TaxID=4533 RepID=J3LWE5_ORYBR